jgi:hypothetical protein
VKLLLRCTDNDDNTYIYAVMTLRKKQLIWLHMLAAAWQAAVHMLPAVDAVTATDEIGAAPDYGFEGLGEEQLQALGLDSEDELDDPFEALHYYRLPEALKLPVADDQKVPLVAGAVAACGHCVHWALLEDLGDDGTGRTFTVSVPYDALRGGE